MRKQLYLLDTCVVSNLRRRRPDPNILEWIRDKPADTLVIAWSTVFEIQYGVELARRQNPDHAGGLENWLEGFVLSGRFRIVRPNAASVRLRARMHATPGLRSFLDVRPGARRPPNGEDLTIAAAAIAAGAVVATLDDGDFETIHRHFPLPGIVNPGTGRWVASLTPGPDCPSSVAGAAATHLGSASEPRADKTWCVVSRLPESWLTIATQQVPDEFFST